MVSLRTSIDTDDKHGQAEEWVERGGGMVSNSPLLPISRDPYDYSPCPTTLNYDEPSPSLSKKSKSLTTIASHRRKHRLANLLKVATCFVFSCSVLLGVTVFGSAGWYLYQRHNAFAKSIFAFPLVPQPLPVEYLVQPFTPSPLLSTVQRQLDQRYLSLSLPPSTLPCDKLSDSPLDGNSTLASRYSSLPHSGPYLLALNLYNSQEVLPTLSRTILTVSDFLGRQNVHVSIFENGSRDNTTVALAHLAAALTTLGVQHTIVSDPRSTDWKRVDRIDQLAVYRNVALAPVSEGLHGKEFEDVLFINDVYTGPTDALELLWQRREQEADAVCAMDWRETKGILSRLGKHSIKMYDSWVSSFPCCCFDQSVIDEILQRIEQVARTMNGNMFRARLDIFSEARNGVEELFRDKGDRPSRERFERGLPIPVCKHPLTEQRAQCTRSSELTAILERLSRFLLEWNDCSFSRTFSHDWRQSSSARQRWTYKTA